MGKLDKEALRDAVLTAATALPTEFQAALWKDGGRGAVCAISRVAQDRDGHVTHVEWGVTTPWLDDWAAGPLVAPVEEVLRAVRAGTEVVTVFPTPTGFARGPAVEVSAEGWLALAPGGPMEWDLWMLARLGPRRGDG